MSIPPNSKLQITSSSGMTLPNNPSDSTINVEGFERLQSEDVLAPGHFWRAKSNIVQFCKSWKRDETVVWAGSVHLLLDVVEFDGTPHTIEILEHPGRGTGKILILVQDFLSNMEPAYDADAVRAQEQQDIMKSVSDIQEEMVKGESNPLELPGVQAAVQAELDKFEGIMMAEEANERRQAKERNQNLAKTLRRATRRSTAAGNPLAVQTLPFSDQVGDMISGGITEDGVRELTFEARRRKVIAEAASKYITEAARNMGEKLRSLSPYYSERAQIALARAGKAIKFADSLSKGLRSLNLYTGAGVEVMSIREGASASSSNPLTLMQAKRFMAEELAVHAEIDDSFDHSSQKVFFDELAKNDELLKQLMPFERCVLSMATTRFDVNYGDRISPYEAAIKSIQNRAVFLLVRNGGSVYAVYSGEPSHEAASRLFPSDDDLEKHFRGFDGSRIGLKDIEFSKSTQAFEDTSLHYKRFLILLCGLDHRTKLFGDFYPPEKSMDFMTSDFQSSYMKFVEDGDPRKLIGRQLVPVGAWIKECNTAVRSGSRVVITNSARHHGPLFSIRNLGIEKSETFKTHIVSREGKFHYVEVGTVSRSSLRPVPGQNAKVWLDIPNDRDSDTEFGASWFLCLDQVRIQDLRSYVFDRHSRSTSVEWLLIFKRAIAMLEEDLSTEASLREYLAKVAVEHGVVAHENIDESIHKAISTWRASRRGMPAPRLGQTKEVNELLSLIYPSDKLVQAADAMIESFLSDSGLKPLKICRTGKNRIAVYVEANDLDKEPFAPGVEWGWVKRLLLEVKKTKVTAVSDSMVWLTKGKIDPAEELVRSWPELELWEHTFPETAVLNDLKAAKIAIESSTSVLAALFARAEAVALSPDVLQELPQDLQLELVEGYLAAFKRSGKYFESPRAVYLMGVFQRDPATPVQYIYAKARVSKLVAHYGSAHNLAQLAAANAARFNGGVFKKYELDDGKSLNWLFFQSNILERTGVTVSADEKGRVSGLCLQSVESHQRGGDRRITGKKGSGKPSQRDERTLLSLNRTFDAIMGKAPKHLRLFNKSLASQVRRERQWPAWDQEAKVKQTRKIKALLELKFSLIPRKVHLSSLLWNPEAGRSHATRYFSTRFGTKNS